MPMEEGVAKACGRRNFGDMRAHLESLSPLETYITHQSDFRIMHKMLVVAQVYCLFVQDVVLA